MLIYADDCAEISLISASVNQMASDKIISINPVMVVELFKLLGRCSNSSRAAA